MAFPARSVVGAAAVAAVLVVALVFLVPLLDRLVPPPEGSPVLEGREGVLVVPPATGDVAVAQGRWEGTPVAVFTVPEAYIEGVREKRGDDAPLPATVAHPEADDHVVFAYSAKSTFLGCTVGWNDDLGASKDIDDYNGDGVSDGRFLDPCHQGQWDAFAGGAPLEGTAAPDRLARLMIDLRPEDGVWQVFGMRFDGAVGPG